MTAPEFCNPVTNICLASSAFTPLFLGFKSRSIDSFSSMVSVEGIIFNNNCSNGSDSIGIDSIF